MADPVARRTPLRTRPGKGQRRAALHGVTPAARHITTGGADSVMPPYRLVAVASPRQRLVFIVMQAVFLVALLGLSSTVLLQLLTPLLSPLTVRVVLGVYCTFTVLWQLTYVYRMLRMRRAELLDTRPVDGLRIAMATTMVPSREFDLLEGKLAGMAAVDPCGNRLEHWVLDEEDDPRVRARV